MFKAALLPLIVLAQVANDRDAKPNAPEGKPQGKEVYNAAPKELQRELKLAWEKELERAEKLLPKLRGSVRRQRSRKDREVVKERVEKLGAYIRRLRINRPPYIARKICWKQGDFGRTDAPYFDVIQIIDDYNMLVAEWIPNKDPLRTISSPTGRRGQTIWVEGISTEGLTDKSHPKLEGVLYVAGTKDYVTILGSKKTVLHVKPFKWSEVFETK